jgi:hypothetical protein
MRNLLHCRRGTVAFGTLVAMIPMIGALALGVEAASWYVIRQYAQNAADAAAYAGGLKRACELGALDGVACTDATSVAVRGAAFASKDGFTNGAVVAGATQGVQVTVGDYVAPSSWTNDANGSFVRAVVSQQQPAILASLLGFTTINIGATAIAQVENPQQICSLGLGRSSLPSSPSSAITFGGSVRFDGNGCAFQSDNSVNYNSTPTFSGSGWTINAVSGCDKSSAGQCNNPGVPFDYYMPPPINPLEKLDSELFNSASGSTTKPCGNNPVGNHQSCALSPNTSGTLYGDVKVNGGSITMAAGTYFFCNANITVTGGSLTGTNVNIVLLGNSSVTLNGGTVNLSANSNNLAYPHLNGVLIDDQAPARSTNAVTINGDASLTVALGGAMYFPNVDVTYGGTSANANTACSEVVANTITLTGHAHLSTNGCSPGTVAEIQIVKLVQ